MMTRTSPLIRRTHFSVYKRLLPLTCAGLLACATLPRPAILDVSTQASEAPAARAAKDLAPQGFAHAEQLRQEAEQAFRAEAPKRAELLAERSLVAFQRAEVQAHAVLAAKREAAARAQLAAAQAHLAELERRQEQTAAETHQLELKLKVVRDAQPRLKLEPSSAKREGERLAAAKAIVGEAGLLCEAARLLAPERAATTTLVQQARELSLSLVKTQPSAALDQALDLRSQCLRALSDVRRKPKPDAASQVQGQFLEKLSQAVPAGRAFRDDRGVVLTLSPFDKLGKQLSEPGKASVAQVAEIARSNPAFPLLVVMHSVTNRPAQRAEDDLRAQVIQQALVAAGGPDTAPHTATGYGPAPEEVQKALNNRKDYVEFVFVTR
jgi:hypothetical protein